MTTKPFAALQRAIDTAGGQAALARVLSTESRTVKQGHVWSWLNRTRKVPAEYVLPIESHTGVSRHDLAPDVFGPATNDDNASGAAG